MVNGAGTYSIVRYKSMASKDKSNSISSHALIPFSSDEKIYQNLNKNFINIQAADSDMDTLYLKNL